MQRTKSPGEDVPELRARGIERRPPAAVDPPAIPDPEPEHTLHFIRIVRPERLDDGLDEHVIVAVGRHDVEDAVLGGQEDFEVLAASGVLHPEMLTAEA